MMRWGVERCSCQCDLTWCWVETVGAVSGCRHLFWLDWEPEGKVERMASVGAPGASWYVQLPHPPPPLPLWVTVKAELDWWVGSAFPTGFLEKNRDVLSTDILTLVHSSQNKFLREIFKLKSADIKLGLGTIRQGKAGSQLFKVGRMSPFQCLSDLRASMSDMYAQGKSAARGWVSQSSHTCCYCHYGQG